MKVAKLIEVTVVTVCYKALSCNKTFFPSLIKIKSTLRRIITLKAPDIDTNDG
jgi:hypothetical protein